MSHCMSVTTPTATSDKLSKHDSPSFSNAQLYRSIVGWWVSQYVTIPRPEITFSVNKVCQYLHDPRKSLEEWRAVKLRYLQVTITHGLLFTTQKHLHLLAFCDARCSHFLSLHILLPLPTSLTLTLAVLMEMHLETARLPFIWCDNSSRAVALAANPVLHGTSKHFELDLFFVRENVEEGVLCVGYVPAEDQVAYILIEALPSTFFWLNFAVNCVSYQLRGSAFLQLTLLVYFDVFFLFNKRQQYIGNGPLNIIGPGPESYSTSVLAWR
ncbi:hypothetical protein QN277_008995 [Acacia crassicarpa]|uniref:Uncharacterized protein n=1 Tax=Acacia crassicarpa TaxID=499986 RepID=A0AAE1IT04_9FABA|nr:hypothetical protein QN277_008995 [Acacia crassicarpa]